MATERRPETHPLLAFSISFDASRPKTSAWVLATPGEPDTFHSSRRAALRHYYGAGPRRLLASVKVRQAGSVGE